MPNVRTRFDPILPYSPEPGCKSPTTHHVNWPTAAMQTCGRQRIKVMEVDGHKEASVEFSLHFVQRMRHLSGFCEIGTDVPILSLYLSLCTSSQ